MSQPRDMQSLDALTDLFRRRLLNDRTSAAAVQGLQSQNTELIKQLSARSLIPFLQAFRRIVERLSEEIASAQSQEYSFAESILDELMDAVPLLGVEVISQTGALDPRAHNSVGVERADVDEPTVVDVIRPGFARAGSVLLPADVVLVLPEE